MKYLLLWGIGATLLVGCRCGEKWPMAELGGIPATASIPEESVSLDRAPKSPPYHLTDLVEMGLETNPETKAAWWQAKAAVAREGRARSKFYPKVAVGVGAEKSQVGSIGEGSSDKTMVLKEGFGPSVEMAYRLFQFGADEATAESARCTLYAAHFQFNRKLQEWVFQVQRSYYQFCLAQAVIEAREANVNDAKASHEAVLKQRESGLAKRQDELRAQAELLQATYEREAAKAQYETCRAELAQKVGIEVSDKFEVQTTFEIPVDIHLEEVEEWLRKAITAHPELQSARNRFLSEEWKRKAEKRGSWPEVTVGWTGGLKKWSSASRWGQNYTVQVGLKWTLFDGFDREYREWEAYAQKKIAEMDLRQTKLRILSEVWAAYHKFKSSTESLVSAKALELSSTEAMKAVRVGYDAGVNNLLDLLSAQKLLAQARLSHIQARADVAIHLVSLACAAGQMELQKP
ncbi:MAG: TolC family protein [Puniceicoccales bacterium]|jgi:outer membrane protein TolC|nr:TolC family protein [Puniceicoccales bacterium]